MNKKNILTFVIVFLLLNFVLSFFKGHDESADIMKTGDFGIATTHKEYGLGDQIAVKIRNNTAADVVLKNECPGEPLDVLVFDNNNWTAKTVTADIKCDGTADTVIKSQQETTLAYKSWNNALFGNLGRYKISAKILVGSETKVIESNEFEVKPQGFVGIFWSTVFYQPLYNILILIASAIPYHDLGLAIILLTIIIRTILLVPSQKGLKAQRKLQEIQPKLNAIREKHKGNQELIAKETMEIWKEHKVNPFGSCLPLLIQFPVLIALFYVIQSGLNPDNAHLLYGSLSQFRLSEINVNFLGILDLTKVNAFVLPLFVGGLQFLQMKLAIIRSGKKKETEGAKEKKSETEMANQMMIYVMPVMIAVFTASVPAGVGLYWSISTAYGIAQQLIVNKQVSAETASVRVIEKN